MNGQAQTKENPFVNILVNIILPVMILNKGGKYLDARWTLCLALALPLAYGVWDYVRNHHKNYVSLLGVANILLTGGLAFMSLRGIWFAIKEASLPFILGALVLGSAWTKNPAARMMFCNPQIMDMDLILSKLKEFAREADFEALLKRTTLWLSLSFFVSALLNFVLAWHVFADIDPGLSAADQDLALNDQIARMTWMGYVVIALPLMVFSGVLIYVFMKRVSQLTATPMNTLLKS